MDKYIDAVGRTIDEATAVALEQLGLDRDSVSVEVLTAPKSGFLGIGGAVAKVRVFYGDSCHTRLTDFLEGLFERMRLPATLNVADTPDGGLVCEITGGNAGTFIGRHGETLDALQHIASAALNRGREEHVRLTLDAEGYRARREASVAELAKRGAEKAVRYRRNVTLDPMNSYSRRIVHTTLQDYPGVTTHSVGAEPERRVVIALRRDTDRDSIQ
ncbi:MAG: protein jag [Oscillospiraceae bacterium]|jgi:spoIIIJ-associated protein|nr:protein jag [Oscillospiraceae bacterium]